MIVGIDLGTTNSAAAIWRETGAELIPNRLGAVLTPSAVSIDENSNLLVGMAARERQATHPKSTVTAFKRMMGTGRTTLLGKTAYLPEELSALVLRSLKEDAEAYLGEPVIEAVITVPAYFNDRQRKATRRAGELAGFKVERLVNEPTAAALAYGINQLADESRFLVFDLGGGTFDVSVLEIYEGVIEVRASTGDNRLGGEDFNEVLIDMMRQAHMKEWGRATQEDNALYQRLREQAERARRTLSSEESATMSVIWKEQSYDLTVTAQAYEEKLTPLLDRLREPVLRSLRDSEIPVASLSEIILIGGTTRMPIIRKSVTKMFGRFPNASINPDEAVALGAAVQAGLKSRDAALKEVVLTDVCPYSLGVGISQHLPNGGYEDGVFSPIIERNTTIPASRTKTYETLSDNQKNLVLGIYQGEARKVIDNIKIGELRVTMPSGPKGQPINCRFTYDINGILDVDASLPGKDKSWQLVITDPESDFSEEELAKRRDSLAKLKTHPRDEEGNVAAMARAERCWADALGEKRDYVGVLIAQFQGDLETQDPRTAERGRAVLMEALDQYEGNSFL